MDRQISQDSPIACDLSAISAEARPAHMQSARQLLNQAAQEVQELPDGFAFRLPAEQFAQVAQFVANERLCCPFFRFVLEVTPASGPLWLRITGGLGAKDFLQAELGGCARS